MSWVQSHFKLRHNLSMYSFAQTNHRVSTPAPPPQSPPQPSPHGKVSLAILVVCVSMTVVVFIYFLLYLLVRFLMTRRPPSPILPHSNRYPEEFSGSDAFQRQLQELFQLQDSGLDQASIDALPVFGYKDIMGSKERYDCAVCLNEFDGQDQLRLLPVCSHAFHVECIDSWLLSNSTCPLCRGSLQNNGVLVEKPVLLVRDDPRGGDDIVGHKPGEVEVPVEKRVLPVRVGKFRRPGNAVEQGNAEVGETSRSSKLDARRCYSMGSYQYVVEPSDMQVTPCPGRDSSLKDKDGQNGRRIDIRSKSESFSVSKIWLWSKKGKFTSSFRTEVEGADDNSSMLDSDLGRLHPQYINALVQTF